MSNPGNDPKWETGLLSGQALSGPKEVEPKTVKVPKLLGPRFESTAHITGLDPNERISVNGTS